MSSTNTNTTAVVETFTAAQLCLIDRVKRAEAADDRTDGALSALALAGSAALADGVKLPALLAANVAALQAAGYDVEKSADDAKANRRARAIAECLYTSKAALAYLALTGDVLALPEADADADVPAMPGIRALLSLVRRVYKGKGLGAPAVRRALKADTRQGAVAALKAALLAAAAKAEADADAAADEANDGAQLTAPATLADIIRGAVAMVTDGARVDASALAALAELTGAMRPAVVAVAS